MREDELLEAIRKVLSGAGPEVLVGPGDDAAVLAPGSGEIVLTTDALVEGVHVRREAASAREIGYKAVAVSVSDIAAMAASPRAALCALTLPPGVKEAWTMELFGGMREACDEFALSLVGGNLARGSELTVTVTVLGHVATGRSVLRSGASAGDRIVVTGSLGGAAAGLRIIEGSGTWSAEGRDAIARQVRPIPRVAEAGMLARRGATAMIDVSDGLALDLSRLCRASDLGARVMLDELPVHPAATLEEALGGGEDYELVATLPADVDVLAAADELRETFGVPLTEIGVMLDAMDIVAVDGDGSERALEPAGWDHFKR